MSEKPVYKKKDFISDQEVRWCPGCGDYAILSAVQMAMTKLGKKKEDMSLKHAPKIAGAHHRISLHIIAPSFSTTCQRCRRLASMSAIPCGSGIGIAPYEGKTPGGRSWWTVCTRARESFSWAFKSCLCMHVHPEPSNAAFRGPLLEALARVPHMN